MLGNLFAQPLSMSSLVCLLVWSPPPHIPYISSRNQCLLFAAHAHTITTCFAVVSILYHLFLVFLLTPYLELCPSCRPTNSVKALKATSAIWIREKTLEFSSAVLPAPSPFFPPQNEKELVGNCCVFLQVRCHSSSQHCQITEGNSKC